MTASKGERRIRVGVIDTDSGFLQVLGKRMDALDWRFRITGGPLPVDSLVAMRLDALLIDPAALGGQAWSYLEEVCSALPGLAVLACTGPSSVAQRVRGLRTGLDDWIGKPAHPEEVVARIEATVRRRRRSGMREAPPPVGAGEIEIRRDQYQAFCRGASVELTRREFELISLLADAEGQVLPRDEIYQRVWGYAMAHGDRSVDVFVRKLRLKLERASPGWRYIHTHFGVGYRFAAERVNTGEEDESAACDPPPARPDLPEQAVATG